MKDNVKSASLSFMAAVTRKSERSNDRRRLSSPEAYFKVQAKQRFITPRRPHNIKFIG
jgi:hypothetical protein